MRHVDDQVDDLIDDLIQVEGAGYGLADLVQDAEFLPRQIQRFLNRFNRGVVSGHV